MNIYHKNISIHIPVYNIERKLNKKQIFSLHKCMHWLAKYLTRGVRYFNNIRLMYKND